MRIRLLRKFANVINGVDLSHLAVGDVVEMTAHSAALLIAEGWAQEVSSDTPHTVQRREKSSDPPEPVV